MDSNATSTSSTNAPALGQDAQQAGISATTTPLSLISDAALDRANEQLLGAYNLMILGFILLFFLAALPGALARLRHRNSWRSGWFLKQRKSYIRSAREAIRRSLHLGPPGPQRQPTIKRSLVADAAPFAVGDSDLGHDVLPIRRVYRRGAPGIPPHVPGWTTLLYPISIPFGMPFFATGFNNAQMMIYGVYAVIFITFAFMTASSPVVIARSGWIVVANMPLMVALGSKNSLVAIIIGSHYGKLNFLHRFIGRLMFAATIYHILGYLVIWLSTGNIHEAAKHVSAWAAFAGFLITAVASLPIVRRLAYNVFYHAHWIGYMVLMIAVCFHIEKNAFHWTLGALFLLGFDHVARLMKSHVVTAHLTSVPDFGATRVEIPQLTHGWRGGQHIRIRTLSRQMGVKSFFEVHPFTIASVSENIGGEGVVLYVKKTGDWTKKLYAAADYRAPTEDVFNEKTSIVTLGDENPVQRNNSTKSTKTLVERGFGSGGTIRMIVEGPYGGPGNTIVTSFSAVFIVVGGSGITYGLAHTEEIIRDTEALQSRVRLVNLIWVVQDPKSLIPMLPHLTSFLDRVAYNPIISLTITIHYTRAATNHFTERVTALPKHLLIRAGRPKVAEDLRNFVEATTVVARGRGELSGVVVLACGPKGLTDDVQAATAGVAAGARKEVGGIEFLEESFA